MEQNFFTFAGDCSTEYTFLCWCLLWYNDKSEPKNPLFYMAKDILAFMGEDELTEHIIETAKNEMLPETARNLAINIVTGGVIIVLFVAVKIALRFVSSFANVVAKLPILDQLNKAGGVVYGLLRGVLMVYVLLMLFHIPAQIAPNNTIYKNINQSYLGKTMYEHNILNVLFIK